MVDHLGDDLEAIISRGQDKFRPPHERWRWAYRRPLIMRGNNQFWFLAVPLVTLLVIFFLLRP
jgi:hypothetical protein